MRFLKEFFAANQKSSSYVMEAMMYYDSAKRTTLPEFREVQELLPYDKLHFDETDKDDHYIRGYGGQIPYALDIAEAIKDPKCTGILICFNR